MDKWEYKCHQHPIDIGSSDFRIIEKDLKKLFPEKLWNKLHLQIIFYGREYCTARGCNGTICKICKTCYPKRVNPIKTKK